ncbi:GNAT family N-acetyltransferase [Nocardioides litoris]|uniref:GNAT family N-acetyltransferase n=1 Tax=Nocardioides litoris TaxID=1926648 RepID=UPI00112009E2|nr:GNAT family N-acetyltransferase [Nocardioides litoris]
MTAHLRDADAADRDVLLDALVEAVDWAGTGTLAAADVLATPELARYVDAWPRPGDGGVVAEVAGEPVGALWWRLFPADAPGYGFVATDVPELSVAVLPGHRGQGVGRLLVDGAVERARRSGVCALSLSVADGNRARRLYERAGFRPVARVGASAVLLLDL